MANREESSLLIASPDCPGPDCPECSGEACRKCGAGITNWPVSEGKAPCEHDAVERHEVYVDAPVGLSLDCEPRA